VSCVGQRDSFARQKAAAQLVRVYLSFKPWLLSAPNNTSADSYRCSMCSQLLCGSVSCPTSPATCCAPVHTTSLGLCRYTLSCFPSDLVLLATMCLLPCKARCPSRQGRCLKSLQHAARLSTLPPISHLAQRVMRVKAEAPLNGVCRTHFLGGLPVACHAGA